MVATDVTTLCQNNMTGGVTVSVNLPPTAYAINGSGTSFCTGGSGIDITMLVTGSGITYDLLRGGTIVKTVVGAGSPIDFGDVTIPGIYTVKGTDPLTSCVTTMTGNVPVSTIALPLPQVVNGGGAYCAGGTGKHIGLNNSATGVQYILMNGPSAIDTVAGSNSSIDFGAQTAAGTYTVIALNSLGCQSTMAGTAVISTNAVPFPYSVSGGGGYCTGSLTGDTVKLLSTDPGIHYQLYNGSTAVGSIRTGAGSGLNFTSVFAPGVSTIIGSNSVTGCSSLMAGSVAVSVNSLPTVYAVGGGGGFCAGDGGADVYLLNSDAGIDYYLSVGTTLVGSTPGAPGLLDFGVQPITGTYTVVAKDHTTQCSSNMTGSATVSINPLPNLYSITGASGYCAGGTGVTIGNDLSTHGVYYTLLNSGFPVGTVLGGTGSPLTFGLFAAGTYAVAAKNTTTGCMDTGSTLVVTMNALPDNTHTVTGTGNFCAGTTSSHVMLSTSDGGVTYQLYNGGSMVGGTMTGGAPIDFGLVSVSGIYTVMGTDVSTKCTSVMSTDAVININPACCVSCNRRRQPLRIRCGCYDQPGRL